MKKWLENYWYHYKWATIISAFFITVAVICIVQIASKKNYNIYIRYVGDSVITGTQYDDMTGALEKIVSGDKKDSVNFAQVAYISDEDNPYKNEKNAVSRETLSSMLVQPYYIYIMDLTAYNDYKDSGVFAPLSSIFEEDVTDISYDEYALYLSKTEFLKNAPGMEWVEEDTVIVIKIVPYDSVFTGKKSKRELASFDIHKEFLRSMVLG
mgnify:FL=1